MRVLIIDPLFDDRPDIEAEIAGPDVAFDVVRTDEVAGDLVRKADAVIACRSRRPIRASLIGLMERTRIIVQAGVGYNHIDLRACARQGIPVCNTPHYGTREVADHAIALTLSLARGVTAYNNRLLFRIGSWGTHTLPLPPVRRLAGQNFGIIGLGRIGTATALRAQSFQMSVGFYDPQLPSGQELALGLRRFETLDDLLAWSDIVSLHCPLTEATRNLIDRSAVARMRPGSVLINTARGGVVDLSALEEGLRSGKVAAAGLDVLPEEPLDPQASLLAAWLARESWLEGRLILTPHAAFYTPESLADMRRLSTLTAVSFLRGGRPQNCVNLDDLDRFGPRHDRG